jgi:hypothetical protein
MDEQQYPIVIGPVNYNMLVQSTQVYAMAGRVEIDPSIMQGKPVIRGTRITVELLLRKLGRVRRSKVSWTHIPD